MRRLLCTVFLSLALAGCTSVFFVPSQRIPHTPAAAGLRYEDLWLTSSDATRLNAWYLPAAGYPLGTVLFLHGNAGNMASHLGAVAWLPAWGFAVLLLDYRGYGLSGGSVDLEGALRDVDAALDHLVARTGAAPRAITVFGQSLGGALALISSARSRHRDSIRAVVADSAFSDFRGIAREKLRAVWWLRPFAVPLSWTINGRHRPTQAISALTPIPVLLMHGEADVIVPVSHAHTLFAAAGEPKGLWLFPGSAHIGALVSAQARERLARYLVTLNPDD